MKMKMKNKRGSWRPRLLKSDKVSIHMKGKWKAVDLDPSLFSEEAMGGLVCFEELTDYRLVDTEKAAAKAAKEPKRAKKRKASEAEEGEGEEGSTSETSKKPVKKKRKKKKNKLSGEKSTKLGDIPPEDGEVKQEEVDTTSRESGEGEASKEDESKDSAACSEIDAQSQSKTAKKNGKKKKKKKRKKKQQAEKETIPEVQPELESPEVQPELESPTDVQVEAKEQPSQDKMEKLPKKQAYPKNWTDAARNCAVEQNADVSAWKGLFVPSPVLKALSSLGFGSPTPIQALALPPAIRDHMDIVGAAETGSGKTLSFGIPMIHTILEWKKGSETQGDSTEMSADDSAIEQDQEHNMEDEEEEEGEGSADQDQVDTDGEDEHIFEEEAQDQRLGCVKVIENIEFDFDTTAEAEEKPAGSQNQPLLGLVLTPTRELAVQVKNHIDAVAKFTDIKTAIVVGGMSQDKQRRMLKRRPEIVIATPGRLWDLIQEKHPHLLNLKQLKCLVIDEADRMVERGHFAELESLLEMLNTVQFNPTRQTFVFSATLTMARSLPTRLLQKKKKRLDQRSKLEVLLEKVGIKSKPKVIDLTRKEATVETLTETRIHCEKDEKDFFLYYFLLQYPGRTMVFANSIDCIKRLNSLLVILDHTPLPLHANMHQKQRLKNLERFAERDR